MNTPRGRSDVLGAVGLERSAHAARPWSWPMMRPSGPPGAGSSRPRPSTLAHGHAGPVGDDGGHGLLVDMGVDHALFRIELVERGGFSRPGFSRVSSASGGRRGFRWRRGFRCCGRSLGLGAAAGLPSDAEGALPSIAAVLRRGEDFAAATDFLHQPQFMLVAALSASSLVCWTATSASISATRSSCEIPRFAVVQSAPSFPCPAHQLFLRRSTWRPACRSLVMAARAQAVSSRLRPCPAIAGPGCSGRTIAPTGRWRVGEAIFAGDFSIVARMPRMDGGPEVEAWVRRSGSSWKCRCGGGSFSNRLR